MHHKVTILGNLGVDPEMRFTPGGESVTTFTVATNRRWTGKDDQKEEETTWFRVSAWFKLAEICNEYLHKGSTVFVEGTLTPDKETGGPKVWTGKDGKTHAGYDVRAQIVKFISGTKSAAKNEDEELF